MPAGSAAGPTMMKSLYMTADGVHFDLMGTGTAAAASAKWGWTAGGDGLLVRDRNHDGVINDGTELYGAATLRADGTRAGNGYAAMALEDSNHDGKLNASDAHWKDLQLWVDANHDGKTDAGELHGLAEFGITELDLAAKVGSDIQNGNLIGLVSTFTKSDGSQHAVADVWFAKDVAPQQADKAQQARPLMHYMAARGFICVSVNYRLSPRAEWPDHLIDVKQALVWVKQHIDEYGGDPEFVIATGGSAGGYLTAMLALTANEPRYQPGFEDADTRVQGAVPLYAPYDLLDRGRTHPTMGLRLLLEYLVIGQSRKDAPELYHDASPLSHVRADAPPFLVVHGTHDSLTPVEEARLFVQSLRAASKNVVAYAELPYAQHAFEIFHSERTLHAIQGVHRFAVAVHSAHVAERVLHSARPLSPMFES